jgi:hypothetical protein
MPQLVHPREKPLSPWYPLDRRLEGLTASLYTVVEKKKISCPCQDLNYYSAVTQPILHQDGNYKKRNEITDQCCEAERLTTAQLKKNKLQHPLVQAEKHNFNLILICYILMNK